MIFFSIIGALVGAGFASGQEIYFFFYKHGKNGILGLILCSCMISFIIYKTITLIYTNPKINTYRDFLDYIFYNGKALPSKYLNIANISNIIINIFLLVTFYIMISGFGAYFEQEFKINSWIGAIGLTLTSYFILIKDIKYVSKVNTIVVPILVIIILAMGIINVKSINQINLPIQKDLNWVIQSVIYCSYNMILVIPELVSLAKSVKNKKEIYIISIISGITIFMLAISIFVLLAKANLNYKNIEMPVVYVIKEIFPQFRKVYGLVILLSIFTTAISVGIGFLKNISQNKKHYPLIVALMCISGMIISNIGFSKLVKIFFPAFGVLGIIQISKIFVKFDKKHK